MSDQREPGQEDPQDTSPSLEHVAGLDTFLDRIMEERKPSPEDLTDQQTAERALAVQMRLALTDVEQPRPEFLRSLEQQVIRAAAEHARPARARHAFTRSGFLRRAAALAGGAGLGVAGVEAVNALEDAQRPHSLVASGEGRWYDVAAVDEVAAGGMKPFSAGGVLGFLLNDGSRLHAVSAICTHMGCRLKPTAKADAQLHCLCHGSRFARNGAVVEGRAPTALPEIALRLDNGRVYALGTREDI